MKRSAIVTLRFATARKRAQVAELAAAYRDAVDFYIGECWERGGRFDAATLRRLQDSPLSYRYKSQALKQADGIVRGTQKAEARAGNKAARPAFDGGLDLSTNFLNASLRPSKGFDLWFRLSTLTKGKPIWLPSRRTRVFNRWALRGALIAGGSLFERRGAFFVRVSFECSDLPTKDGPAIGVDRGVRNVLATSEGQIIGKELDRGKRGKLSRACNRRFSHWTVGRMSVRLRCLAGESCTLLGEVDARDTSRRCPACGHVEKSNRRGDSFRCIRCDHADHADVVGGQNVLARWMGTISVPHAKKS